MDESGLSHRCGRLPACFALQIIKELKEYHNVDMLDDVRVIKDRATSMFFGAIFYKVQADFLKEMSRGFGFLRFPTLEQSRSFLEKNHPYVYLSGKLGPNSNAQAAKVRIAYSRERDDRSRAAERLDGEWTCKIVRVAILQMVDALTRDQCTFVNFAGRVRCHKCASPQISQHGSCYGSSVYYEKV